MSSSVTAMTPESSRTVESVKHELVLANRILWDRGVVDAFGHVSHRSPIRADRFFISRSLAPVSVTHSDIVELDLDGVNVDPQAPRSYLERFIHSEIYRARPDVHAVVHSHSPAVLPFAVVPGVPLRSVCHVAAFIGAAAPLFEIRDVCGDTSDLLVSSPALGAALAAALVDQRLILMRGHGVTTVGSSLRQAIYHAVNTEVNARIQIKAVQLGEVSYLSPGEIESATRTVDATADRAWDMWAAQAAGAMAAGS